MSQNQHVSLIAIPNFPDVQPGDDVAQLLSTAVRQANLVLQTGDVLCLAQKIISKAENRYRTLADVTPSAEAEAVAEQVGKDARLVELILGESTAVSRLRPGVLITRHRLGFVAANAGIDRSNALQTDTDPDHERVLLLPVDPDGSAQQVANYLHEEFGVTIAVIITDSHGRPFRLGTVGVAIGATGLPALWDKRGQSDRYGYRLRVTDVAFADEIAAAAGLLMGQGDEGQPAILVRGLNFPPTANSTANELYRPPELDLYA
jgi:coenzyme F420-0:L-glutamate ligase / coenzyme F420-1:gamma-L-glutamate ligase